MALTRNWQGHCQGNRQGNWQGIDREWPADELDSSDKRRLGNRATPQTLLGRTAPANILRISRCIRIWWYQDIRISENISTEELSISMMNDAEWASIALGLQAEYSMNNCFGIFKMNLNSFPTIHMHAWKGLADWVSKFLKKKLLQRISSRNLF